MKKLLVIAFAAAVIFSVGCHVSDYPVITDDRGSFSGVIRTGHNAYIVQTSRIAFIYPDGTDELINFVYQNRYGDQKLFTKRNYDPTGLVVFQGNTYCDWRANDGCYIATSWNPATGPDNIFDVDVDTSCQGARSLKLLASQSRQGECGDMGFWQDTQSLAAEFANLATTTFRGDTAYIVPVNASNTNITLDDTTVPIYGQFMTFLTNDFNLVAPVTPNARHQLRWMQTYLDQNDARVDASITYGSLSGQTSVALVPEGIAEALKRF